MRALVAAVAEAAGERHGPIAEETRTAIPTHAAAVGDIGASSGEDLSIAIGPILPIEGLPRRNGIAAAALELPDPDGVIEVQVPKGLILLGCDTPPMSWLVFRPV